MGLHCRLGSASKVMSILPPDVILDIASMAMEEIARKFFRLHEMNISIW